MSCIYGTIKIEDWVHRPFGFGYNTDVCAQRAKLSVDHMGKAFIHSTPTKVDKNRTDQAFVQIS